MIAELLAAALTLGVQAQERTLLPGYADLPVIGGEACPEELLAENGGEADCVVVSVETINEVFEDYAALLQRSGWRFNGGAAVVFYYQRDRPDGGCEGIDLAAMADFEMMERPGFKQDDLRFPSMIMFFKQPEVACAARSPE